MHQHCNLLQNLYGWPQHHAKAWQLLPQQLFTTGCLGKDITFSMF